MQKKIITTILLALFILAIPFTSLFADSPPADLILTGGRIWTGNESEPWVSAVAVVGNRIIATGDDDKIEKYAGEKTQKINLKGRFAMPGINDSHIHFLSGSLELYQVNLFGARSLQEIQRRVADYAKQNPNEKWITGSGWEYSALPGNRLPTRRDLDAVVRNRPVILSSYDGHTAWANSKALEMAGINSATKFKGYGEIVFEEKTKEPSGVLKEGATDLVERLIPEPSRERKLEALRRGMKLAAELGITSIQNASGGNETVSLYEELLQRGELTLRTSVAISVGPQTNQADINRIRAMARKYKDSMLRVGAIKIMVDGVIETHTAAMLQPYSDDSSTSGKPNYTQAQLNRLVAMADRARLQIYIHAIGDRGVRMALNAFEHARKVNGIRDSRFRIEHIETISKADIPRFARLGVIASMEPIHGDPGTNGVWLPAVGPERGSRGFAWRTLEDAGARLIFSSDWPAAISIDPMRGLHNAVNRRTIDGEPEEGWLPEQRVSLETALKAYTVSGAYASFEEKTKGKITPGMLADIIVFNNDPFKIDPMHIHKCKIDVTVFNGRVIHKSTK
jgi:predicted amidohydrolase YtcJ